MKHGILLAAVCIMTMAQGWATPVDTLSQASQAKRPTQTSRGMALLTGSESGNDDFSRQEFDPTTFIPISDIGSATGGCEANGSSGGYTTDGITGHPSSRRIWANPSSVTFTGVRVGKSSTKQVTVYTMYITDYMRVSVTGTNKSMFSVDTSILGHFETDCGANWDKPGGKLYITYRPTKAGTHKAQVVIKEHYWFFPKTTTITLKGTATSSTNGATIVDVEEDELAMMGDVDAGLNEDDIDVEITFDNDDELEAPLMAAPAITTGMNELTASVKIFADGQNIVIDSPMEQQAIISDIAGRSRRVALTTGRNVIPAISNGVHIVRVGEQTAKLMLR